MRRTTWILLLVFGLLVLFAWLFQRNQAKTADTLPTSTAIPAAEKVYNLTNLQLTGLKITDNEGGQIDLYRDSSTSNNWAIKNMPVEQTDKVGIETAISQLLSIQIIDRLTANPPLESMGLASPVYTLTMQTGDGRDIITNVGIKTPVGTGYYIRVDSGPIVIVDNLVMDEVLNFVKTPPLVANATPAGTLTGTPIAPDSLATPTQ